MPTQITKTVYTFKELLDLEKEGKAKSRAVERARQWFVEGLDSYDWYDSVFEWWKEALGQIGFDDLDISFRGFSSQGDGASFTARVDLEKLIRFMSEPVEASDSVSYDGKTEDFRGRIVKDCGGVGFNPRYRKLLRVLDHIEVELKRDSSYYVHEHTVSLNLSLRDRSECIGDPASVDGWRSKTPRLRRLFDSFQSDACQLVLDACRAIYSDLQAEYDYRTSDETIIEDGDANGYTFTIHGERDGWTDPS